LETDETNPLGDALGQNKKGRGGENYMSKIKEELERRAWRIFGRMEQINIRKLDKKDLLM
jgi:hypothetical protein